jgi:ribosome-associated protein
MSDRTGPKPSKTRRKRESEALQSVGEALIDLPPEALAEAPIPDKLREAVELARRLTKHGALRRQRQYIGKLMREIETDALDDFLAQRAELARAERRRFHALERWRDRILADGEPAVEECARALGVDEAELRRLAAMARGPADDTQRRRAGRALFRYLNGVRPPDRNDPSEG